MTEEEIKQSDDTTVNLGEEEVGTEIRDTDIVFDCPHCGHNLAIDYRGAGLQIACVNCGESVLVPIPDGMKIDDLDIEPGEILKQLFATRRNLQRTERRVEDLQAELAKMRVRYDTLQALLEFSKVQIAELKSLMRKQVEQQEQTFSLVDRLTGDLETGLMETLDLDAVGTRGEAAAGK